MTLVKNVWLVSDGNTLIAPDGRVYMPSDTLTFAQIAELHGVNRKTVWQRFRTGSLLARRCECGTALVATVADVLSWKPLMPGRPGKKRGAPPVDN